MTHYLLDTNTISFLIRERYPALNAHARQVGMSNMAISVITEAELLHGLALKPHATRLAYRVHMILNQLSVLAWDRKEAASYAHLKVMMQRQGIMLAHQDLLIAAHAYSTNLTLITNDQAFFKLQPLLDVEDWTV
jgi:tRNA(fMet)-specific endonuclease VapC